MTQHYARGLRMLSLVGLSLAVAWPGCGSDKGLDAQPDAAASGTGGTVGSGGKIGSGGTIGTGGAIGTGGTLGKGGTVGSGGTPATGGTIGVGGTIDKGGTVGSGGIVGVGGAVASGGTTTIVATGGKPGTGGTIVTGTGGKPGTGGTVASGGKPGTGGTTTVAAGGVPGTGGAGTGGQTGIDGGSTAGTFGNPDGHAPIPAEALPEDVSKPTTVVGTGTPESCTGDAFIAAVAKGGVITFACGPDMATIRLTKPAKVFNDKGPKIVIDGGGKITLSGENVTRILYMNTCDEAQVWTSERCDNQSTPQLTVQNLTFANGNSKNETVYDGGGAIYASGGRFKAINSRFINNVCADTGPDLGGGAIRVFQQYNGLPAYVVSCTFGGADGLGNVCSNGGALSSIGVSWTVLNSIISYNHAIGNGGNPADPNTPGGGSGGGIYNDGNTMTLTIAGTLIQYNKVNAYGSAIFFVSNDHSGNIVIDSSTITNNIGGSWYPTYPQISNHDDTPITVTNSTIK
jgi:hypothetical protein